MIYLRLQNLVTNDRKEFFIQERHPSRILCKKTWVDIILYEKTKGTINHGKRLK
jgi:hypothetical protein